MPKMFVHPHTKGNGQARSWKVLRRRTTDGQNYVRAAVGLQLARRARHCPLCGLPLCRQTLQLSDVRGVWWVNTYYYCALCGSARVYIPQGLSFAPALTSMGAEATRHLSGVTERSKNVRGNPPQDDLVVPFDQLPPFVGHHVSSSTRNRTSKSDISIPPPRTSKKSKCPKNGRNEEFMTTDKSKYSRGKPFNLQNSICNSSGEDEGNLSRDDMRRMHILPTDSCVCISFAICSLPF